MKEFFTHLQNAFHDPETRVYRYVQGVIWTLIILSIVLLVIEAILPTDSGWIGVVQQIDQVLLAIFALEIVLRVVTFQPPSLQVFDRPPVGKLRTHIVARLTYLTQPLMLVDILSVLALFPELRSLRLLRLLRLLRTTKIFRYKNPFEIVLQALEENSLLFGLTFSILGITTLLGGASMYLVEVKLNPDINSAMDGIWWALVTITTVGFGDITPVTTLGRIIGAVLMIAGMFTLALFAGIVGSSLVNSVLSIREEQFRMSDYVNHVVVCGYDESSHLLLDALEGEMSLSKTRVVIFDDHDRPRELPPQFVWVRGNPTKESELDKVRLTHATAAIISGERDTTPQVADARTILTTFTIRSYMRRRHTEVQHRKVPLYVVAEILDTENVDHASAAGADEVIETRRIGYAMIAHAVGYHGIGTAMSRVLISGSHSVYIGIIPDPWNTTISFGKLMLEMQLSKRGGLVVGVRTPDGQEVINPPKDCTLEPGSQLLYLAEQPLLDPPK